MLSASLNKTFLSLSIINFEYTYLTLQLFSVNIFFSYSTNSSSDIARAPETNTLTLMSSDMKRELLRQKWEKEEQESRNQPIHYSNVRYDGNI